MCGHVECEIVPDYILHSYILDIILYCATDCGFDTEDNPVKLLKGKNHHFSCYSISNVTMLSPRAIKILHPMLCLNLSECLYNVFATVRSKVMNGKKFGSTHNFNDLTAY